MSPKKGPILTAFFLVGYCSFLLKITNQHDKKEHFSLPKFAKAAFIVKHFAAEVEYLAEGFLEKNKDAVSEELVCVCVCVCARARLGPEQLSSRSEMCLVFCTDLMQLLM